MANFEKILNLTSQLYPTGRAFKMPLGGWFEKLNRGLVASEVRLQEAASSVLDSALPDNPNFTAQDATDWEERLGMISNESLDLAVRMDAIKRKMNHPGVASGRQSAIFLQGQLQAANFPVYIHENIFVGGPKTPEELTGDTFLYDVEHGEIEHGEAEHGGAYTNLIANHIDEERDYGFIISDLNFTFFVGGETLGDYAFVPEERKAEFRELILKIKPLHTVGFLLINYI